LEGKGACAEIFVSQIETADFVIVGAGVMGCSLAFHLAQRRAGKIVVLDKEHVGKGASGRSSALVRMHYSFPPEVMLAVKSLKMFQNWQELVGEPGEFHRTGFVRLVPQREFDSLAANVAMQKRYGVDVQILSCDDLQHLEPEWNLEDEPAAAYEYDGGYGDGAIVAQDFMFAARRMGVAYYPKTAATEILKSGDRVSGVATEKGSFYSPNIIIATGHWTGPLLQAAGVTLPISPEFHQVAILRNPVHTKPRGCACIDSVNTLYFRPDARDKVLLGDFYGDRNVNPDNCPQRLSDDWVEEILQKACCRIPGLQNAELMGGITGIYDMTPDSRPMLGGIPGIQGLYLVAGFSGMGFKISPAVGLVMSELLLDGQGKTVDITPFRPSRFEEGKAIKPEFEYADD
jgi:sarcosine oxidase subunit beta